MVYSDNAPDLEYKIHKQLAEKRINLINNRREFFRVELDEVEDVFGKAGHPLTLTKLAEAKEYRESIAIRESQIRADKELAMQSAMVMPLTLD
ncbi:GIY-YIG nuclease family protein [Spirosoma oryzicola]|nr:GIY-YIG nuclease family protein [Spirosoma oryzicola]UHG89806.1 GIY-YIG nuclease family protein [Spirosoma oryzicola]